jgi:hypothetical protein
MSLLEEEFIVNPQDNIKKSMFHIKEKLKEIETINIISGINASNLVIRICDSLVRLNYVTYDYVSTFTKVINNKRQINLKVILKKTTDFDRLYEINKLNRLDIIAKKEKIKQEAILLQT